MSAPPSEPVECPKACGARVWLARSSYGHLGPYDAEPSEGGTWALTWSGVDAELRASYAVGALADAYHGRRLYRTHYATCPQEEDPT